MRMRELFMCVGVRVMLVDAIVMTQMSEVGSKCRV